ncbi:DUF6228 family protein [Streptomyces sp. SS10]|uniref:DUF6228 family protein n=1 Tax=Streptomyces sp. I5 TaxID=2759947 RepID=UPI0015867FBF|nr:DUF6228 family protein [Streptomyces sp. I5]MBJ6630586.1 hypothetical protein [Streptomyces sp. I5]
MIDYDDSGALVVQVGEGFLLSEPLRPYEDDPTLGFLVTAHGRWGSVATAVETWDGDGLDTFLASLAEDFRGWQGERTWHSLCHDLTLSAEHRSGGYVQLRWVISDGAPTEEWRFETSTWHEAGEGMRTLAADIRAFIGSAAE